MRIEVWHNILWSRYKGQIFAELYKIAQADGVDIDFYQIAETTAERRSLSSIDLSAHKYPYQLLFGGNYEKIPFLKLLYAISKKSLRTKADLVVIAGYDRFEYWAQLFILFSRRKKIVVFCDSTANDRPQLIYAYWFKKLFFSLCDAVLCYGERSKDYVQSFGVDSKRIATECQAAVPMTNISIETLIRHRIDARRANKILFVGRLSPEKNLERLLDALVIIRKINPEITLHLVGGGSHRSVIETSVAERAMSENVIFVGSRNAEELLEEYLSATCLVLPSLSEPWGLVVNEALSCGCPVVVSRDCGCVPELVRDGQTGFVVDPYSPSDIASRLTELINPSVNVDAVARECIGVVSKFTSYNAASHIFDGCKSAMSGKAVRRRRRIDLSAVIERLSPEMRTTAINNLVAVMPGTVLRLSEELFDIPIADVVRRSQYLFIHIPKNAGTTVNMALYGRFVGHRTALWYRRADRAFFDSKLKFAIMRDPLDRFISAFYYLKAGGTAIVPASSRATKFMSKYQSIAEFIKDVETGAVRSFRKMDPVFHEQCEYIMDEAENVIVDRVFLLSNIQQGHLDLPDKIIDMKKIINKTKRVPEVETAEEFLKIRKFVRKYYARDYAILDAKAQLWLR